MVEFIDTPPRFEAVRLKLKTEVLPELKTRHGLKEDMYLLSGQVSATMRGANRIHIETADIQVVGFNTATNQMHYNVVRVKNYEQNWDLGGAYLKPELVENNSF